MYQKNNPWYFIAGLIVILSIFFTIISGQKMDNTLEIYQGNNQIGTDLGAEPVTDDKSFETQIYTSKDIALSMEVPADFGMVIKSGYETFVHAPSGTSIQIQVNDYDPAINNISASVVSEQIVEEGYSFISFTRLSNSSYEAIYQKTNGVIYDYIEEVYWDREHIVVIKFIVEDTNYQSFSDKFIHVVETFSWNKENPIPDGYYLYYCEEGNFEIGLPEEWNFSGAGNSYYASDPYTNSQYMVQYYPVEEYVDLSTVTATDMTGMINTGKAGFMMETFYAESSMAQARASFISNDIKYVDLYTIHSSEDCLIYIIFEFENGLLADDVINELHNMFRKF